MKERYKFLVPIISGIAGVVIGALGSYYLFTEDYRREIDEQKQFIHAQEHLLKEHDAFMKITMDDNEVLSALNEAIRGIEKLTREIETGDIFGIKGLPTGIDTKLEEKKSKDAEKENKR